MKDFRLECFCYPLFCISKIVYTSSVTTLSLSYKVEVDVLVLKS